MGGVRKPTQAVVGLDKAHLQAIIGMGKGVMILRVFVRILVFRSISISKACILYLYGYSLFSLRDRRFAEALWASSRAWKPDQQEDCKPTLRRRLRATVVFLA